MPAYLLNYIAQYGYVAIFCIVLIQELGIPSFPNEIVLLYAGYLASQFLFLPFVVATAVLADVLGTLILYFIFLKYSALLKKIKPKWLRISPQKIIKINNAIKSNCFKSILPIRLTPFLRGYVSVFAGLFKIPIQTYSKISICSTFIWSGGWVLLGWCIAPYWQTHINKNNNPLSFLWVVLFLILVFYCFFKVKQPEKDKVYE